MSVKQVLKNVMGAMLLLGCLPGVAQAAEGHWVFKVFLDQKEIGYHEFEVAGPSEARQVRIDAQFDVKFLFINAYSYSHQNQETWYEGCLHSIDALTDDNGDEFLVSGSRSDEGFALQTGDDVNVLEAGCLRSFAYWDPVILQSRSLLNSQTGEIVDVEIESRGLQTLQFGASSFEAEKYEINMKDGTISLWYDAVDGRWLALEAPAKGGRTIRYEPVILPNSSQEEADRLAMD